MRGLGLCGLLGGSDELASRCALSGILIGLGDL